VPPLIINTTPFFLKTTLGLSELTSSDSSSYVDYPEDEESEDVNSDNPNVVFKKKGEVLIIKGGTIEELVNHCVSPTYDEAEYVAMFLLSYRSFSTDLEILNYLTKRYSFALKDTNLSPEHAKFIKLRVMNALKLWVDQHSVDFEDRQSLFVKQFYSFVSNYLTIDFPQIAEKICEIIDGRRSRPNLVYTETEKTKNLKKNVFDNISLISFNAKDVARQLTLISQEFYILITPHECFAELYAEKNINER